MVDSKAAKNLLANMNSIGNYFHEQSKTNPMFAPEFEASAAIIERIEKGFSLQKDADEVISIYNSLKTVEHYNGSGWFDFGIHLKGYLRSAGFNNCKKF